ncbi:MAG: hypothetical protein ACLR6J_00520 [Parabacteroides merdae]
MPKLVKLVSPLGIQQNYIIEKKYKFVDLLIVGGGGGGGTNSGGGGASGTIAFARNIKISLLPKTLTCKIAKPVNAQTDGDSTTLEINGDTIICAGGQRGNSEGAGGLGNGSKIPDSIYTILSKLVENPSSDIAICNNGGGSPGYWNGSYGYAGGSGASMSGNGNSSSGMTGGNSVSNADGMGGYKGGNSQSYQGGTGYKYNNALIPIGLFGGGGTSGKGSNGSGSDGSGAGGGAAGLESGGNGGNSGSSNPTNGGNGGIGAGGGGGGSLSRKGGKGGQGIICLYYHRSKNSNMIYIHKDINFWKTKVKLPDSYLISTDIDDYEVGAYLPLSEEQEQYHNEHPDATPLECWHMQPAPEPEPTPEELLWRARDAKRQEIYDKDIHHYYIDEQDAYVSNTLQVKDKCGRQEEVEVGGHLYASNILTVALDEIADYSEQCAKVTDGLLSCIDAAQTAEEVRSYRGKGYPEMIHTTTAALQTKADKAIAKSPEAQAAPLPVR